MSKLADDYIEKGALDKLDKFIDSKKRSDFEARPWGAFEVLEEKENSKIKRLEINPNCRISYQRHKHRSEQWHIVSGLGLAVVERREEVVVNGDIVYIESGIAHRLENIGADPLIVIEVQRGEYLGEDDVERLADDYQRF